MIDLHTHTIHSDGTYTVEELLIEAQKIGLLTLSVTDHNSIGAYKDLEKENIRSKFSGEIISGVEITTTYNGEVIEVLGYGFDLGIMSKLLDQNVLTFEQKQLKEFELIKNTYINKGIKIDIKNIIFDPKKESSRTSFCNEIKKYGENDKYFLYKESIETKAGFTRNEVYNPKSPLYVNEESLYPSLEKTIDMIHEAGGIAFLAHTFAYSPTIAFNLENIINNYKLDGLECFYTTFTREQTNYLLEICQKYNLLRSGGSDFHGANKINHNLGIGNGNLNIKEELILDWDNKNTSLNINNIK